MRTFSNEHRTTGKKTTKLYFSVLLPVPVPGRFDFLIKTSSSHKILYTQHNTHTTMIIMNTMELPAPQDVVSRGRTNLNRKPISGSADPLLTMLKNKRRASTKDSSSQEGPSVMTRASGAHSSLSASTSAGNMSAFFLQQRTALVRRRPSNGSDTSGSRSRSNSNSTKGNALHQQQFLRCRSSPRLQQPRNNNNDSSLSPKDRDQSLGKKPKLPSGGGLLRSHVSAPGFGKGQERHRRRGSNESIASQDSTSSSSLSLFNKGFSVMQTAQRSNGSTVKSVIAFLKEIIITAEESNSSDLLNDDEDITETEDDDNDDGDDDEDGDKDIENSNRMGGDDDDDDDYDHLPEAPIQEMAMLAQWSSVDAYYRVVISKYQGIATAVKIMNLYPNNPDIQIYGILALTKLPNKRQVHEVGGVQACLQAMKRYPTHIEIQSQAFAMLKAQGASLLLEPHNDLCRSLKELLLVSAKSSSSSSVEDLYLTQPGREGVTFVKQFLETYDTAAPPVAEEQGTTATTPSSTEL